MINETGNTENTDFADEAELNSRGVQSRKTQAVGQAKEVGKKGLEPLIGVLTKHKSDFTPYFDALTKALRSGAEALESVTASEAERTIAKYFHDGADRLTSWKEKLSTQSPKDFLNFLEEEGKKRPAVLFGASYFGGILLGRFGRHLGKNMRSSTENIH